ncbi:hypothetical protein PPYR_08457 [Photinus pyralis]|uniref:Replication protein A OB domain-containing protein n=2 Tax=Photinus pyralis TaxID=7054 RepID=A0A5N4AJI6_PHOPY|nr:meiosis-specific with OB domain-containing protein [Photinus pyralis]KAB0797464.1 hypothetical protein PPYR_08457 [Photinus pyralis]
MEYIGLQRVQLHALTPELLNGLIVGIIIAKQEPRVFTGRDFENVASRAVWNFTLRDSPLNYINVTCWGTQDILNGFNKKFSVGDVVNVIAPQIEIRRSHGGGENFRPMVTSPYTLILNDVTPTRIMKHEGNWSRFSTLMNYVTKPIAGAVTIADIHNMKDRIDGLDIFGIVRLLGKVRNVTTSIGVRQVRDIMILDQTSSALKISFWDPELIARAGAWKILHTVLFITDVRCEWSKFMASMTANITSRSVITENPLGVETENLRKYVAKVKPMAFTNETFSVQDISLIRNVMNIQQVLDKGNNIRSANNISFEEQQFTALLYAVVTQLDLDGLNRLLVTKCSRCDTPLENDSNSCSNTECIGFKHSETITAFDLRLMLTDQTGSLIQCRLYGETAEKVLNCSVRQFLAMSDEEKTVLKWKLLMERCAVRIHVMVFGFRGPIITVLSCDLASPIDVANRIPHY